MPSHTPFLIRLASLLVAANLPGALALAQPVPPTTATFFSDPQPSVRYNNGQVVLRKELASFGNYGAEGAADILYTGQAATWHFALPSFITPGQAQSTFLRASLVADDHSTGASPYTLAVWANGAFLGNGPASLPYGAPFSSAFTNWTPRDFPVANVFQPCTFTVQNTSNAAAGDWIAVDWLELHLALAAGTVLPNHASNAGPIGSTIVGAGLNGATRVTLTGIGPDIPGQNLAAAGDGALSATFDLTGAAPGIRGLVVQTPAGTVIVPGAFMVQQGAGPAMWLTNFQIVSQSPASGGQMAITYRADLANAGPSVPAISVTLSSLDPFAVRVLPGQDTLSFASVPANGQITSSNSFTVLIPAGSTLDAAKLQSSFQTSTGAPIVNPGPNQSVKVGATVTLDGSASMNPGGAGSLSYEWAFTSRPPGTNARLFYSSSIMPAFVADVAGMYVLTLTVTNGVASNSASVTVTATE